MTLDELFINNYIAPCSELDLSAEACMFKVQKGIDKRQVTEPGWDIATSENPYLQVISRIYYDWVLRYSSDEYAARYVRKLIQLWIDQAELLTEQQRPHPQFYGGAEFEEPLPEEDEDEPFTGINDTVDPFDLAHNKVGLAISGVHYTKATSAIKMEVRRNAEKLGLKVAIWSIPHTEGLVILSYKDA